jgi:hypothetical protein
MPIRRDAIAHAANHHNEQLALVASLSTLAAIKRECLKFWSLQS